jgi:hypothetical protein
MPDTKVPELTHASVTALYPDGLHLIAPSKDIIFGEFARALGELDGAHAGGVRAIKVPFNTRSRQRIARCRVAFDRCRGESICNTS